MGRVRGLVARATDEEFGPEQAWTEKGSLSSWLVEAQVRSVDARGAEVRLDLGTPLRSRPLQRVSLDSRRWVWRHVLARKVNCNPRYHINQLEMRAVLLALNSRLRSLRRCRRFVHLVDSQVTINVLCKWRTSYLRLLPVSCNIAARTLGGDLLPTWGYVKSSWNLADEPSRLK